jgi:hypothetical protein
LHRTTHAEIRAKRTRRSQRRREERELFFWTAHEWCRLVRRVIYLIVLLVLVVQLLVVGRSPGWGEFSIR